MVVAGGYGDEIVDRKQRSNGIQPRAGGSAPVRMMVAPRDGAAVCVLADGRFATMCLQTGDDDMRWLKDEAMIDLVAGRMDPLPSMVTGRQEHALVAVAVAGGMIAMGGTETERAANEPCDVESGRWMALPHAMQVARNGFARVVSVPATVFASTNLAKGGTLSVVKTCYF